MKRVLIGIVLLNISLYAANGQSIDIAFFSLNANDDPTIQNLAETTEDLLNSALSIQKDYSIEKIDFFDAYHQEAWTFAFLNRLNKTYGIRGTITRVENAYSITVEVLEADSKQVKYKKEMNTKSALEIFDLADSMVLDITSALIGRQVGYGTLKFNNVGAAADYEVLINDTVVGNNLTEYRLISGTYEITLRRKLTDTRHETLVFTANIPRNETLTANFDFGTAQSTETQDSKNKNYNFTKEEARQIYEQLKPLFE